jgi:hypothetical protein
MNYYLLITFITFIITSICINYDTLIEGNDNKMPTTLKGLNDKKKTSHQEILHITEQINTIKLNNKILTIPQKNVIFYHSKKIKEIKKTIQDIEKKEKKIEKTLSMIP